MRIFRSKSRCVTQALVMSFVRNGDTLPKRLNPIAGGEKGSGKSDWSRAAREVGDESLFEAAV